MILALSTLATAFPTPDGRPAAIGFTDSATHAVRCHYERESDAPRCDDVLLWAGEAWDAQVTGIGFHAPLPDLGGGGSDSLDIYLTREAGGSGSAWVQCANGYYNCVDSDPTDAYLGTPSIVVIDPRTEDDLFRSYVHHEFNHTLQYSYDFIEPFLDVWEGTAVAAEHWTDPSWATLSRDFVDYQTTPWLSAVLQDGYFLWDEYAIWSYYEYGSVTWIFWMDEEYGDGAGSIGPAIWEALSQPDQTNEPDLLDAWTALSGDWQASMMVFAADRARIGTEAAPGWAEFGGDAAYPMREATLVLPVVDLAPVTPPFPLGTTYYDVAVTEGDLLTVTVTGTGDVTWGLALITPSTEELLVAPDGPVAWTAPVSGVATVAVVNLAADGFDADDPLLPATFLLSVSGPDGGAEVHGTGTYRGGACQSAAGTPFGAMLAGCIALARACRRRPGAVPC